MSSLAPPAGSSWTTQELAQTERLSAACKGHLELECGHTDVGDPWCIVYDKQHHRVVLHLARIDRRYVIVWPLEQRSMETARLKAALDMVRATLVA
jgi:hypothetical protein